MKMQLKIPPKSPEVGDTWEREDGTVFTWTVKGWINE